MGRRLARECRWQGLVLLLLLATAAAGPLLFHAGLLNTRGGGDSPFLLFRLHQLVAALKDGQLPVRWMPDAAYGLGYPFFSYYAALPYYLAAGLVFWGLGLIAAIKLTQWLAFALAAWGIWGLVRHAGGGRRTAGLAAAAYTFAPYHLVNLYVRGDALGELWAMSWYPWILWAAARLCQEPSRRNTVLFGLSYAALVFTHNISALIFSPFLLAFLIALVLGRDRKAAPRRLAAGLLLGLSLAAFYWLPALGEQDAVQLTAQTTGYLHYDNHFRSLVDSARGLVQPDLLFSYDVAGPTPFSMGAVQAALTVLGVAFVLFRATWRRALPFAFLSSSSPSSGAAVLPGFSLVTFLVSTLMITPLSAPLWEHVPLLPMVQFPWRFLSVQALAAALLIGETATIGFPASGAGRQVVRYAFGLRYAAWWPTVRRIGGCAVAGSLTLLMAAAGLVGLRPDFVVLTDADVTPARLQWYEWFSGNVGTTIRHEYLPRAVVPRLYTSAALVEGQSTDARALAGEATASRLQKQTGRESWQVDVRSDLATVSFPTLYWPGWQAWVDGSRADLRPAESLGTMVLNLPAGQHRVELVLGRTPLRLAADLLSTAALLLCAVCWIDWRARATVFHWLKRHRRGMVRGLLAASLLLLSGLVLNHVPRPVLSNDDLTWDFDQQAFLHHNPAGVRFGEAAVMQDYQVQGSLAQQGQGLPLQVAVHWSQVPPAGYEVELALVHPAEVVNRVPYTLARVRRPLNAGLTTLVLANREPIPPGPLLLRLRLLDPLGNSVPALTSAGNRRGDLYLAPIQGAPPDSYRDSDGALHLLGVDAETPDSDKLAVWLQWGVGASVPANLTLALRLLDGEGVEWAAQDAQPGYGFYPTGVWRMGTAFGERLVLEIPYGLPPGDYSLSVILYEAASLQPRWGPESWPVRLTAFTTYDQRPLQHRFSPSLAVAGLTAPASLSQGEPFGFTMSWAALGSVDATLVLRWELVQQAGLVVARDQREIDADWPAGSVVLSRISGKLDPQAPPGACTLRLAVLSSATGEPIGPPWDAATVEIREQARRFDLPELQTVVGAEFGGIIRLEGVNLEPESDRLPMVLYWRALQEVPADYLVFVHLFDPTSERIVAQSDAMPRSNSYPTSRWAPGEVVEDPISLSLTGVPTGRYRVGLGLYWKEGQQYPRLPAVDAQGAEVPDGRLVLPNEIVVP